MIPPKKSASGRVMLLDDLLQGLEYLALSGNAPLRQEITSVTCDSREVVPGSLFVAVKGYCTDGQRFIGSAVEHGATVVLCEEFPAESVRGCCCIQVSDARKSLALAANLFYGKPSEQLQIIGVTGTNGKTTTAKLMTAMLNDNGITAGYIGTHLCTFAGREIVLERTTPESHELHALFREMVDSGCRAVVMEVSSHALVLQRVFGIRFHAALFTNLSMEHLDFHQSMAEYGAAKQLLFDQLHPDGIAVLNIDDPYACRMAERVADEKVYCCTMQPLASPQPSCGKRFEADILSSTIISSSVVIHFPQAVVSMQVGLPGSFNVMNVLEAAVAGFAMGVAPEEICRSLSAVTSVEGRMERVSGTTAPGTAFVDYAHTPDALFQVLATLGGLKPPGSNLIVVFGCGGDRDRAKRPEMGRIASESADFVIITSDNPRNEDPELILDEIEQGITGGNYIRISDRAEAIRRAVALLGSGDVLLVAGKGHEKYQEIMGRKEFFSDQEYLRIYMQEKFFASPGMEGGQ